MYEDGYFKRGIDHYETKRVAEECPLLYRIWMLKEIARVRDEDKIRPDYLQIFRFSLMEKDGKQVQKIVHSQEKPEYEKTFYFAVEGKGLDGKIYIIDDGARYATTIFAEEY